MQNKSGWLSRLDVKAFTLIELLVVVLIIGILAAVAVPQYQKAVMKSRYATLKNLTRDIANAQEIFYLSNGSYSDDFEEFSLEMPTDKLNTSTSNNYVYTWGRCHLFNKTTNGGASVRCDNYKINMGYGIFLQHESSYPAKAMCYSYATDSTNQQAQICNQETSRTTPSQNTSTELRWFYP